MHLVVVCPRCKRATGVREEQKSATCPRCGRAFHPRRARAYHRTDDPAELARLVGEMNARLEGGFKRYEAEVRTRDVATRRDRVPEELETIAERVGRARGRQRQLEEAVGLLCGREEGGFAPAELVDVLKASGWDRTAAEEVLGRLLEEGVLTEPRQDFLTLA